MAGYQTRDMARALTAAQLEKAVTWHKIHASMDDDFGNLTFEEALRSLEETVALLESGNLTLEESLMLFERGQKLAAHCGRVLDKAQLRVEMLTDTGELVDRSTLA